MKKFFKYLSLYGAFFRASLTADLEFRANFVLKVITDIFWYVAQIASFEVLFNFTNQIGGWGRAEMRIFLGVLFVADAVYMVLFQSGLDFMGESVRKGNLDLLLTKPVNSQFMLSFQRASTANMGNLLIAVGWLLWAGARHPHFTWMGFFWLALTLPCGIVIFYSLRFAFSATTVVLTRAENLQYLWYNLYRLGLRPDNIYPPWLHYLVLTLIPVGMIASVPARLLLGTATPRLALASFLLAVVSLKFSNWVWNRALRSYTSASS